MYRALKDWRPWLVSLLFYVFLISLATQRQVLVTPMDKSWGMVWAGFLPWNLTWALLSPVMVAIAKATASAPFVWRHRVLILTLALLLLTLVHVVLGIGLLELGHYLKDDTTHSSSGAEWDAVSVFISANSWHGDFQAQLFMVLLGFGWNHWDQSQNEKQANEALSQQLVEVELATLRSQLNSHFLFNTLNSVTSLIRLDEQNQAVQTLSELAFMLRKVLENQGEQWVSIKQEMAFINSYLRIQKMRFEDKLEVHIEVDEAANDEEIPFLLLHPLVENALQHGFQLCAEASVLSIEIKRQPHCIQMLMLNRIPEDPAGFNQGLEVCQRRLDKHYQQSYRLRIETEADHYIKTTLLLPLDEDDDQWQPQQGNPFGVLS